LRPKKGKYAQYGYQIDQTLKSVNIEDRTVEKEKRNTYFRTGD
jgi:hypothetical protein